MYSECLRKITEADMNCENIFLAELSPGSPYFNPVFMQLADLAEFRKTGSLDLLRRVYMSHDSMALFMERSNSGINGSWQ